ncbi:MAG: acyl-CoA reductase [Hyphomonadaceae bacterium]
MTMFNVPLVIRGRVIEDADVEFGGRGGDVRFTAPDVRKHLKEMPLSAPSALSDLYAMSFEEILDYLDELGNRLTLSQNSYLQEAYALSCETSGLGPEILKSKYTYMGMPFQREIAREIADTEIGIRYLEGWVDVRKVDGYVLKTRAFGARGVHIVAGNSPAVTAVSILRNAMLRSDAIIKTPSNDPLTASAIARTMIDMAPDHPITKHISVAYWKGGDEEIEDYIYQPRNIEKVIAWGGMASIKHIAKYIQPGIDLITLDPKLSSTIIGREAFSNEQAMAAAALRLALDIGVSNQEGCVNARTVYIESGTDDAGLKTADRFGQMVYEQVQSLPPHLSGPARRLDPELAQEMEGLKFAGDGFKTIGGGPAGAVIVSHESEPVDFAPLLKNRVANLVPVDDLENPIQAVNAFTQTIGIYPESLIPKLRDRLAFNGTQRLISLGYANRTPVAGPWDGIEPLRRSCKWIIQESYDPEALPPLDRN